MVITLDKNKKPPGSCTERRARILMEKSRACVYRYFPFTIIKDKDVRRMADLPEYRIKIDPGAKYTGIAAFREDTDEPVFGMQIEHKGAGVAGKLETRRNAGRNRGQRETGYRKPKWGNKTPGKGRKPQNDSPRPEEGPAPSVRSIAEGIMSWVRRLCRLFNITACSFEANRFDTQLTDNPDIEGEQYQHGTLYGYEIREYLLDRYGHTCQYCGGVSGDRVLEWEHGDPRRILRKGSAKPLKPADIRRENRLPGWRRRIPGILSLVYPDSRAVQRQSRTYRRVETAIAKGVCGNSSPACKGGSLLAAN